MTAVAAARTARPGWPTARLLRTLRWPAADEPWAVVAARPRAGRARRPLRARRGRLAEAGLEVHAYDQRGFGGSGGRRGLRRPLDAAPRRPRGAARAVRPTRPGAAARALRPLARRAGRARLRARRAAPAAAGRARPLARRRSTRRPRLEAVAGPGPRPRRCRASPSPNELRRASCRRDPAVERRRDRRPAEPAHDDAGSAPRRSPSRTRSASSRARPRLPRPDARLPRRRRPDRADRPSSELFEGMPNVTRGVYPGSATSATTSRRARPCVAPSSSRLRAADRGRLAAAV